MPDHHNLHHFQDDRHPRNPSYPMWPVQTLTLLLCLTDEEQLFAQRVPTVVEPARVEVIVPAPAPVSEAEELLLTIC